MQESQLPFDKLAFAIIKWKYSRQIHKNKIESTTTNSKENTLCYWLVAIQLINHSQAEFGISSPQKWQVWSIYNLQIHGQLLHVVPFWKYKYPPRNQPRKSHDQQQIMKKHKTLKHVNSRRYIKIPFPITDEENLRVKLLVLQLWEVFNGPCESFGYKFSYLLILHSWSTPDTQTVNKNHQLLIITLK